MKCPIVDKINSETSPNRSKLPKNRKTRSTGGYFHVTDNQQSVFCGKLN